MTVNNYPIRHLLAHHFTGPTSNAAHNFRTVPIILRAIADWMEEHDVQDPDFQHLDIGSMFEGRGDSFYEAGTLYYLEREAMER